LIKVDGLIRIDIGRRIGHQPYQPINRINHYQPINPSTHINP
jgi:hypothetical protein